MSERRRAALKQKRIRQVKRQITLIVCGVIVIIAAIVMNALRLEKGELISKDDKKEQTAIEKTVSEKPEDVAEVSKAVKEETEEERLKRVEVEAKEAGYPKKVIKLLSKNPETVDFVEAYGEKKDVASPEIIEELKEGEIPKLIQWDERWGYAPYGTDIIAVCGCGPTTLSMVLAGLTGDNTLTPVKLAKYGTEKHYVTEENDTSWSFMTEACKEWGVKCKETMLDAKAVQKELDKGHVIVCSVGPGVFTQNGHFILLAGHKDGKIIVHDPFSISNSNKTWDFKDFKDQIKVMWVYSR